MAVLLTGLTRAIISPDDEIFYENRPAEKLYAPSAESYMDKSFQDSVENVLSDQVNAAIKMKKLYNIIDTSLALPAVKELHNSTDTYIAFRDIYFYKDVLVKKPVPFGEKRAALDATIKSLNQYFAASEETDFFVYYIETDRDIDFDTNQKSGFYEHISSTLALPSDHISKLSIDCFEDYSKNFLHTDHHWNGIGAYNAYLSICKMLGSEALESKDLYSSDGGYLGTRAAGVEGIEPESFSVNIFDFPTMDITINDNPAEDYGMQSQFISNQMTEFSYGSVFGPDCREIIFDTGNTGNNLLVMGDSYDNAIVKALATGFSKTYCIDLRAYGANGFDLIKYVDEHDIDSVLFIGAVEYFSSILY